MFEKKNFTKNKTVIQQNSGMSALYMLGFIGAVVYYVQNATTFWMGVAGFLKALVWPAYLVYHLMQFLRM